MTTITFIHPDNRSETVEAEDGATVMLAALTHGVDGIVAECGGNAVCATCHVYVDDAWTSKLEPVSDDEDALLDGTAAERRPNSRLSCQIKVQPALAGLVVRIPDRQS
ncbi:MAG: 2Fe-2S iron-sulfur cluster-binding protein [Bradyrhizobium sp.]|jgi:2Fe-2S ferredoxin|uniref:(2Fe-2S)-binding protein n=1 Tax=Bradyrhizobium denitrificans TaxID=2734912 RepID=A0ABS5GB39_9BRAD|nr:MULTISPECIES: 2Fe-2S iron-sulfur cluster-binding protein [Bradyrhizobium]ABQ32995.1 2Fe-2S ferredoxin (FdII) [Bradyrhizobium sp. BTAi1]MBR1137821.1 (2Fe-2S)-binding protein [Bradyrhizobium denitrificans]MDU0955814.1 2Fe-2S iron-sulfur cluster-binding protein [Bradyrhizobium sp.]MDU1490737.1 2Fe-2S iron-sulfur cluster-binding protein [Bradyrhizobium sp.]MDU1540915.1 2Fe-2S iron-sulfur cluster-binding protein [Bradyrhizobium sp.]